MTGLPDPENVDLRPVPPRRGSTDGSNPGNRHPSDHGMVEMKVAAAEGDLRNLTRRAEALQRRHGRVPDSLRDSIRAAQKSLRDLRRGGDGMPTS